MFESLAETKTGTFAFGCSVLSEEYSNPWFIILTLFAFPTEPDLAIKYASFAVVFEDPTKFGNFLYPDPPETMLILLIGPSTFNDSVVYSKEEHSLDL